VAVGHPVERPAPASRSLPTIPRPLIAAAGVLSAGIVGRLLADGRIKYGLEFVVGACLAPIVFLDITIGLAMWVAVQFFSQLHVLSSAPNVLGLLVGLAWIGVLAGRRTTLALATNRTLLISVVLLCLWITLSIAWASAPGTAGTEAGYWWWAALALVIVLTTARTDRDVRVIVAAFVAGAVVSVLIGIGTGGLSAANASNSTAIAGRLTGGGGDPNAQAAGYVAAMFLIVGLMASYRQRAQRIALGAAFLLISVGFVGTQSRGGLIAFAIATLATFFLAPRQRRLVAGLLVAIFVLAIVLAAIRPSMLQRLTDLGGGTSGRSDLWIVAWRVFISHPLVGVGAANFTSVEAHYTLAPGMLTHIQYIVEQPHLVHNSYLQLLAETGIVGLLVYALAVGACLRAGLAAVRLFDQTARPALADLARTVIIGTIAMLAANFFISNGDDLRLWVLLGLCPAMYTIALTGRAVASPTGAPT
jgi:O-antigen ligase